MKKTASPEKEMSFLDHLEELRWHLIRSTLAVVVLGLVAFIFKDFIFDTFLFGPKKSDFPTYKIFCNLSQSMGIPGQTNHPKVLEAMRLITDKANKYDKVVGTFIETPEDLRIWKDLGLLYLSYKVDVGIFYDACYALNNELKKI